MSHILLNGNYTVGILEFLPPLSRNVFSLSDVSLMPDLNFEITDLLEGVYKTDEHIIKILQFMCIHCDTLRAVSSVCVLFTVFFLILLHT